LTSGQIIDAKNQSIADEMIAALLISWMCIETHIKGKGKLSITQPRQREWAYRISD